MRREGTLEEISDGRLYQSNDMVRADCQDCKDCFKCCCGCGDTIQLDPMDVSRISKGTGLSFEELSGQNKIDLTVVDGIVLPSVKMQEENDSCGFLNEQGRCSIHAYRPGICRLFPLGRYYEEGKFSYFLQTGECVFNKRTKVKVSKWIDTPELKKYEKFVTDWHYFLKDAVEWLHKNGMEHANQMSTTILQFFYLNAYTDEFYIDYAGREEKFRRAFSMG